MEMPFVPETIIDKTAGNLGSHDNFEAVIQKFKSQQPVVFSYLFSESFELLTQNEREYLFFLAMVIWRSFENTHLKISTVTAELLETLEEENWEIMNRGSSKKFNERIDPFFINYPQEDLLAFVEDALVHDEDSEVTKEGRDYMFIALKTIIDSFHNSAE